MRKPYETMVAAALEEDIAFEDITTNATVASNARCDVRLLAKQDGVLSGIKPFHAAFSLMDAEIEAWSARPDGTHFKKGDVLASFRGNTQAVLSAERTAINFVQILSGVATLTAAHVAEVEGLDCRICDTRKTLPLLRQMQKAAVVHGGGANHRHTLMDAILIKDNHIEAAGGITSAIQKARRNAHHLLRIEVEVTNLDQFEEAIGAGADVIMLDNMDIAVMREAVKRRADRRVILEASGNANIGRLREIAETGVDFISVGALTHSAPSIDLSLLIEALDGHA